MKQITPNIATREIIVFCVITLIAFIIWFAGPHLVIANHYPLFEPEKRFGLIMVIFLGWLLLSLVFATPVTKNAPSASTPEIIKKLQTLQGRFEGAVEFLKKTIINKHGELINLSNLPWYLLIGPKNSGKTSLLAHANINFILSRQFKTETLTALPASEICDWWVTRDLVLVDIPSSYIDTKEKSKINAPRASLPNVLWHNLLNLVHNHRKQDALNGLVITLNLPELLKQQNHAQLQKSLAIDLRLRINELREKFGKNLPCYFIITKCDLIPGFLEFFNENSSEELAQAWGITLPALAANEKLSDMVVHRFNALIKRLNKQLLWRLHQERNPHARTFVKDFPLYMERIKETMRQFVKSLGIPDLCLNGIFFTSSIQANHEPTTISNTVTINQESHQALQILQHTAPPSKPFFIRQLLMQALFHKREPATVSQQPLIYISPWYRRAVYAISITTILASALFLGHDFRQGVQLTYSIQNNLTQYQLYMQQNNQQEDHLIRALPLLNALQEAAENSSHQFSHIASRLAFYSNKSQQTADEMYNKALQTIILPEIKNDLEKYLQTASDKNLTQLYAILQAYLMLGDNQHVQPGFVASTLIHLLPTNLNKQAYDQLNHHITVALSKRQDVSQLDTNLILEARKQLTNLSRSELAYVILKNLFDNNLNSEIKLGTDNPSVFISKELDNQIPNMFTASGFKTILSGEVTQAASEASQGNWVIGELLDSQNPETLIEQLRAQYIANYIDIWESQLANIKLFVPKDFTELHTMLATLTSNNSPLLQMLKTIQQNTAFDTITSASPKLAALNNLLANVNNDQDNVLYQMFVSMRELKQYVQAITSQSNIGAAVFAAAKQHAQNSQDAITHMNALAQQIPDPMKTWLSAMSTQTWALVSRTAAHYVDLAWQKQIMSIYHSSIANRYPFSRTASDEVNLQDFTNFMGQRGTLAQFYQTYLKPFIDDSQLEEWHWRNGVQQLPFKNELLTQLRNAAKIQRAFFPNGDNQLYVQFSLQPVGLEANVKSFNLAINGQQINYKKREPAVAHMISWPGNTENKMHATRINFVTPTNQLISDTLQGDWGWFRLVDKATRTVNSRKEIELNFVVNGYSAKYLLFTQGHLNPFLPLNLESMQLPETLV